MAKNLSYADKAKLLKKLGLIDYPIVNLNRGHKSHITKLFDKYNTDSELKRYFDRPGDFSVRKNKNVDIFKKSGFMGVKNKVVLPSKNVKILSVGSKSFRFEYRKNGMRETAFLADKPENLFAIAAKLKKRQGKNQLVSFKMGDNATSGFSFNSIDELMEYLKNVMAPRFKDPQDNFWPHVSIVSVPRPAKLGALKKQRK